MFDDPRTPDLPAERQAALASAARTLSEEFDGVFSSETIERFLLTSYADVARRMTVITWLPLLAERFARERLTALAIVEGRSDNRKPVVLFLCTHNAGRSQMAHAYFRHLAGERAISWSGGSEPSDAINPAAVAAMAEIGIDIADEFPKPWTDEVVRAADVVITMGCGDACPVFPGKRYEDWGVADPAGRDLASVRPIRDEITSRVESLLANLGVLVG